MTGWLRQIVEDAREHLGSAPARDYLYTRGFSSVVPAREAGVGYLPASYFCTASADFLKWAGSGERDRLRGRLVFPYTTADGQIIGLQTRSLTKSREGRYQSYVLPAYKGIEPMMFNADHAARQLYTKSCTQVVVVEGPMDVLAVRAAGETAVIATHTAMVPNTTVEWLRRWSSGIVLALLDMDEQGRAGVEKLLDAGLTVAAPAYAAHDPSDLWQAHPDALRALVCPAQDDLALLIRGLL